MASMDKSQAKKGSPVLSELLVVLGLSLAAFLPPFIIGRNGFVLLDHSIILDPTLRILHGQVPYVDFILVNPPTCLYMQAIFFLLFGLNLYAPLIHAGVVNVLATLLVYGSLRKRTNPWVSVAAGLATAVWFYLPFPFPWFDTTAYFFVLLAQVVYALHVRTNRETSTFFPFLMGLFIGIAFFGKQNISAFAFILYAVLLWLSIGQRRLLSIVSFAAGFVVPVGGYLLYIALLGGWDGAVESIITRPRLMGRVGWLFSLKKWSKHLSTGPLIILVSSFLLVFLHALLRKERIKTLVASLDILGLLLLCILSAITGSGPKYICLPFMGLLAGLFSHRFVLTDSPDSKLLKRTVLFILFAFLIAWGFKVGLDRTTRRYALKRFNYQTDYALQTEALKPFYMSKGLGKPLDDVIRRLIDRNAAAEGLYVFPNPTVIYFALDYASPQPYSWINPSQSFFAVRLNDEERLLEAVKGQSPKWIVLWNGYQFTPDRADLMLTILPKLGDFIKENYDIDHQHSVYCILRRRD